MLSSTSLRRSNLDTDSCLLCFNKTTLLTRTALRIVVKKPHLNGYNVYKLSSQVITFNTVIALTYLF